MIKVLDNGSTFPVPRDNFRFSVIFYTYEESRVEVFPFTALGVD